MRARRFLILGLLVAPLVAGGLLLAWRRTSASRELDRRIAALPAEPAPRSTLSDFGDYTRTELPVPRLIELLLEAGRYGAGASLGDRAYEMPRRRLVLTALEARLLADEPDQATRRLVREALSEDLARDPGWPATLRAHRDGWYRWLARLREGGTMDESEVLGPPRGYREIVGGRRIGDGAILGGWRSVERFFERAEQVPLSRDDFGTALDALVETPPEPEADPVTAYFARFATRDLKTTWRLIREVRDAEERLLRSLE